MSKSSAALTAAALLLASACGGRVAQPVLVEQSFDAKLSCAHLAGELSNNEKRLIELKAERDGKPAENLGFLLTSPLFIDLSESQKNEVKALIGRNSRLKSLMAEKGCEAKGSD
ncbi:MAG: hypothetical protein AAB227_03125 [Pseudomonadota bacterium]